MKHNLYLASVCNRFDEARNFKSGRFNVCVAERRNSNQHF